MLFLPLPLENHITAAEFDPAILDDFRIIYTPRGRSEKAKRYRRVYDCVCAFDIETTGIKEIEQSVMYIWQMQIDTKLTIFGRTWAEFQTVLYKLRDKLQRTGSYLFIYVHNLSYEFCWLKGIYDFEPVEVFAVQRRKVLTCRMYDCIEFRCSYILSNMSLAEYTKKMRVFHVKLSDFDYNVPRFPWTGLTVEELRYCQNDVLGLVEAIRAEMEVEGDTLRTIPLTSTGFVRRDVRNAINNAPDCNRNFAKRLFPTESQFRRLREAFRGGDTHGSRYYCDQILENVTSYDRSSSYPDVLINYQYPVTPFVEQRYHIDRQLLETMIYKRGRACLFAIRLRNVRLRNRWWGCPYLSKDKSREIKNGVFFNGRILSADSLETTITDVDYRIINREYLFEPEIVQLYSATYGDIPRCVKEQILKYYRLKTELKGVKGSEVLYMKSKNKLNSIYGMMATSPAREEIRYTSGDRDFHYAETPLGDLLKEGKDRAFLPYQWGVWCTAWARLLLHEGINLVAESQKEGGAELVDFIYCDTDSVKFIGSVDWSDFNSTLQQRSETSGAYADDPRGNRHYMGVYEADETYEQFKTLGAKKYAGIINGKLTVTIAGVNKKKGGKELAARGGLPALRYDFTFVDAGGVEAVYNDLPEFTRYTIDGHDLEIISNVYLRPSTYTVGSTMEFRRILEMSMIDVDKILRT